MQYLVTIQASLKGKYPLRAVDYRIICSSQGIAARKAWTMYKRDVAPKRRPLDDVFIRIKKA